MAEPPPGSDPPDSAEGSAGRQARIARLYELHGAGLYRYAVMLLADAAAAEDAIQQVFASMLRQRGRLDHELHYLRRAVRNECYSMLRARRSDGQRDARPLLERTTSDAAPEERLALERAIRALPLEQREVVHLHAFEGWTFQQIADASETSINTVAARYRYALGKLRERLTSP
jgi:RNA polymerase sigma-70 factor (ECF subfamily)